LGIAVTKLNILEGNICAAVCTYERRAREFGIGWGWKSWALLKGVWSYIGQVIVPTLLAVIRV